MPPEHTVQQASFRDFVKAFRYLRRYMRAVPQIKPPRVGSCSVR